MKLSDLLNELRRNVLRDVSDSVTKDQFGDIWTDESLVMYINEAQNRFATKTLLLRDETTPEVTEITLVEGQEVYSLDSRVRALYGARIGNLRLSRTTYAGLTSNRGDVTLGYAQRFNQQNGTPRQFYTDRETGKIGVYPSPDGTYAGMVLKLRVARTPLESLVYSKLEAVPEIQEDYQLDILEWAAWRALRNHDTDGENMAKASAHKKQFNDAVMDLQREAKRMLAQDIQFDVRTNWESC